jgi:hypothetical protein
MRSVTSLTITSLNLSSIAYIGNRALVHLLNISHLPTAREISINFNVAYYIDEEGETQDPCSVIEDGSENTSTPNDDSLYEAELGKRMPSLEHVKVDFAVENQHISIERKQDYIMSTRFTRTCLKRRLLTASVRVAGHEFKN